MDPFTAILAARVGAGVLGNLAGAVANSQQKADQTAQQQAFQKLMLQLATSPQMRAAVELESRGIKSPGDLPAQFGDLASRICQDPSLSEFLGGEAAAFELRFHGDGVVTIRTHDGRSKTVKLELEDARQAALQAEKIHRNLQLAGALGIGGAQDGGALFGLRYKLGSGRADLAL